MCKAESYMFYWNKGSCKTKLNMGLFMIKHVVENFIECKN